MKTHRTSSRRWSMRESALLACLLLIGAWVARAPLGDILAVGWRDEEQSHTLLAPLVAGWLLWQRRERLKHLRYSPSLFGPLAILAGWLAIYFGYKTDIHLLEHLGAFGVLGGCLVTMAGLWPFRQFLPVCLVMLFAIPVPGVLRQRIAEPLQSMATVITHEVLGVMGVPSERMGNMLVVEGQQVAVGEACNGMRMVFALTLVAYAFVFSVPFRRSTRILLVAVSPLVALLCNIIRLVPTSIVYGYGSPETAESFHDIAGWVMLPIALAILVGVLKAMRWLDLPITTWRLAR